MSDGIDDGADDGASDGIELGNLEVLIDPPQAQHASKTLLSNILSLAKISHTSPRSLDLFFNFLISIHVNPLKLHPDSSTQDGAFEGISEGLLDGAELGTMDGCVDGELLGIKLGIDDGTELG